MKAFGRKLDDASKLLEALGLGLEPYLSQSYIRIAASCSWATRFLFAGSNLLLDVARFRGL